MLFKSHALMEEDAIVPHLVMVVADACGWVLADIHLAQRSRVDATVTARLQRDNAAVLLAQTGTGVNTTQISSVMHAVGPVMLRQTVMSLLSPSSLRNTNGTFQSR